MSLRKFTRSELAVSPMEAWQVLVFFFGGNAGTVPGWLTDNDRSFAQALLIEAVDASYRMSWIEKLWSSTVNPSASIKSILGKLAVKAMRDWLTSCRPTDLNKAKIYTMVKDQLTRNWRSAWQIRIETGEDVY
ncbi:MAG: hypothetical protein P4L85_17085 [Paludisphaera borealis]|uniref:hypothetical protein n=1 Tax=Paludisphaera borealis TaxID=1387353 RepID=UPI0028449744|nr:hypothetical protein [Paludisphaera borealis]MDR3621069.1 hypothetical protein [Paludisphaera borealis]